MRKSICYTSVLAVLFSCGTKNTGVEKNNDRVWHTDSTIRYAKRFSIASDGSVVAVYLFGKEGQRDTGSVFLLDKDAEGSRNVPGLAQKVKIPCGRIAALSSIYAGMLAELGAIGQVAAIDNIDYVSNAEVIKKHSDGNLPELARMPEIDLEKTIALKPDIVFTFGMAEGSQASDTRLQKAGIPVAVCLDHLEETPLARAEWIKFFGEFAGRRQEADSIFAGVEREYLRLSKLASSEKKKPTVFNEIRFGDTWYMPGGKSYIAKMLQDAGADYLWKDEPRPGSLPLSFEQVYARARDAEYWIHLSTLRSKKALLDEDKRYGAFAAFRKGNLFNNTKVTNRFGYSPYWETGMTHPERILNDLIWIFHPGLRSQLANDLYYYEQLK